LTVVPRLNSAEVEVRLATAMLVSRLKAISRSSADAIGFRSLIAVASESMRTGVPSVPLTNGAARMSPLAEK